MASKPTHPLMIDNKSWDHEKVMQHICDQIATSSKGIGSILKAGYEGKDLPTYSTIMKWLDENPEISDKYAKAKEAQADFMADEMLEIADDGRNDYMEQVAKDGRAEGYKTNGEAIARSRLRVDTRKWLASKLKAKKYGDKVQQEVTGPNGGPVQVQEIKFVPAKLDD